MVETALGKRARKPVVPPQRDDRRLAQAAARDMIAGKFNGATTAARAHGLPNASNVSYWYGVLRGLDPECYEPALERDATTRATGNTPTSISSTSTSSMEQPTPPTTMVQVDEAVALPSYLKDAGMPAIKAYLLDSAVQLYKDKNGKLSIRDATATINRKYEHLPMVPQICASTVHSRVANPGKVWQPHGRQSYLPDEFYEELVRWIKARRALKFPVFKDDVLATANAMASCSKLVEKYKDGYLTDAWYYNFLTRYNHHLGTAKIKTLEIDRERWATAENLRGWYNILSAALIAAKVAVPNPDFKDSIHPPNINAQPVFIVRPERIVSFDKTRLENDMTRAGNHHAERTLIDKTAPWQAQREAIAHKGGQSRTGVGGSTASGKALPGLFIFKGLTMKPHEFSPVPLSQFLDATTGQLMPALYTANKNGGMEHNLGVLYMERVVRPCFPDLSADNPIVILCDGHGSHLTLALIKFCRDNHMHIILRVPHTSHLTQGEDLANFKHFKVAYRKRKHARFAELFAQHKPRVLKAADFMPIVAPAWEAAFAPEHNLRGWKEAGIVPFTRSVMHMLAKAEQQTAVRLSTGTADNKQGLDYSVLTRSFGVAPASSGVEENGEREGEEDEGEEDGDRAYLRGRFSSAQVYSYGPITQGRGYELLKEMHEARQATEQEKEQRRAERAQREANKTAEMHGVVARLRIQTRADIDVLTVKELLALLVAKDAAKAKEYRKLKGKAALLAAAHALYADLPAGNMRSGPQPSPAEAPGPSTSPTPEQPAGAVVLATPYMGQF